MATSISMEELGITPDQILERTAQIVADKIVDEQDIDITKAVTRYADEKLAELFERELRPLVQTWMDNFVFRPTNNYGEPTGEPMTFAQWFRKRAEEYLTQPVNAYGRTQQESRSRGESWTASKQTKIVHMIHEHFIYEIESVMKAAVASATAQISGGIQASVKAALEDILSKIKCEVKAS